MSLLEPTRLPVGTRVVITKYRWLAPGHVVEVHPAPRDGYKVQHVDMQSLSSFNWAEVEVRPVGVFRWWLQRLVARAVRIAQAAAIWWGTR